MLAESLILPDLYATAHQPDRWTGVLDTLAREMDVISVAAQRMDQHGSRFDVRWSARDSWSTAMAARHDAAINNHANPRLDIRAALPPVDGEVVRDEDRFTAGSPALADLRRRLAEAGLGRALGVFLRTGPHSHFAMILHRRPDDGRDFGADEREAIGRLIPHLRQMLRMTDAAAALRHEAAASRQMIDLWGTAVLLCTPDRRIAWTNAQGQALLARSPVLGLAGGRLACPAPADARALADLLAGTGRRTAALGGARADPLHVVACPVAGGRIALFLGHAHGPAAIDPADVAALFALSPAEARLAAGLSNGLSLSECAAARGITLGTARVQLKQALGKTRAGRQAELVRRIGRSVAAQVPPLSQMGD